MDTDQDLVWLEPISPKEIIEDELIKRHKKDKFYVLYSGGQDSACVVDYIAKNYPENFGGAVFTNTGIASANTRQFVLEYHKQMGWPLEMTWARKSFYDIVMSKGFPGPGSHKIIMGYLKFHSWYYYWKQKIKKGEKACFISGVRKKESVARDRIKFYSKKPIDVTATMTFAKPFLYKNGTQLQEYFIKEGLKKSPNYGIFGKSSECWCGCFYNDWELKMLEKEDPFVFGTIQWLESQLKLHGTKEAQKFPKWGRSVGANYSLLQNTLDDFIPGVTDSINDDYCGESCSVE